jgi:hypothetical protein
MRRMLVAVVALLVAGCEIPTTYTVRGPTCPWPPPQLTDTLGIPLGCPWREGDSIVQPFPVPLERAP